MLVRVVALALIAWSVVELAVYWIFCHQHLINPSQNNVPMKILPCLERSVPLLVGIVLLVKSRALAEWVSNILDD